MIRNMLKEILVREGITQSELSKESGLSVGMLNRTCNNHMTPSPVSQSKIAKALCALSGNSFDVPDLFPRSRPSN